MSVELERFVRERAENYGALRQSAITAVALDKAADQLQRYREDLEAQGWQPIGTAPRDGTLLRVAYGGDFLDYEDGVYWQSEDRCCVLGPRAGALSPGWSSSEIGLPVEDVTHWRPLPDPPARQALQEPKP